MTNEEIMKIALQQSAEDCNCNPEDFLLKTNKVVISKKNDRARLYLPLPFSCDLVSYGNNIIAQVREDLRVLVSRYIHKFPVEHCFEMPNLHVLNEALLEYNLKVCFMAEYFLPDMNVLKKIDCDYQLRLLYPEDLECLYTDDWSNALSEHRKKRDLFAIGAFDENKLIGLAGCSADCDSMYQIGVDVLLEYRKKGIASALTSHLALEILKLGKVPFYCCAWSNISSVRNAIKSGFKPAWVEVTAREIDFVNKLNH